MSSLERSSEVTVTYQAHHKHSQCQSEIKIKGITSEEIPKQKNARATPLKFFMSTTTLFSCHKENKFYITYSWEDKKKTPYTEK